MKKLKELLAALDGNKSYILVAAGVVLWAGEIVELWSWAEVDELWGLLALLGVGAGRSALKKLEQ